MMFFHPSKKAYFQYLKQRSLAGYIYRNWLLYPRLDSYLQGRVLDFGCGIGDFLRFRKNAVGVDINRHNIEYCHALGLDAAWIRDGTIPFQDNSFTSVIMDNVLEHIPAVDVDATMDEVGRVLQAEGTVVIGVPGTRGYHSDPDHKVFYTEDNLTALFDKHGLMLVKSFHMPLSWPFLDRHMSQYCLYAVFQAVVAET